MLQFFQRFICTCDRQNKSRRGSKEGFPPDDDALPCNSWCWCWAGLNPAARCFIWIFHIDCWSYFPSRAASTDTHINTCGRCCCHRRQFSLLCHITGSLCPLPFSFLPSFNFTSGCLSTLLCSSQRVGISGWAYTALSFGLLSCLQ